jgi:hypothetical protein
MSEPNPADPGAVSDALDELEERVVGRRVNPPHSSDLGEDGDDVRDDDTQDEAEDRGSGTEPSG